MLLEGGRTPHLIGEGGVMSRVLSAKVYELTAGVNDSGSAVL